LTLGLKPETADMAIEQDTESTYEVYYISAYPPSKRGIPAWSLHRLIELLECVIQTNGEYICIPGLGFDKGQDLYDNIIDFIEWLIRGGYFNEEYLNKEE
jgi:hypothetical protein